MKEVRTKACRRDPQHCSWLVLSEFLPCPKTSRVRLSFKLQTSDSDHNRTLAANCVSAQPPTGPSAAFLRFSADHLTLDLEGPGGPAASTPDTHAERRPPGGGGGAEPAGQASRSPRHHARGLGKAANATEACRLTSTRQAPRSGANRSYSHSSTRHQTPHH